MKTFESKRKATSAEPSPDRVWVTFGRTVNTGDYSSIRIDMGAARDQRDGESVRKALHELTVQVVTMVDKAVAVKTNRPPPVAPARSAQRNPLVTDSDVPF